MGVSCIKGTAEVKLSLDQTNPSSFALYKGQGKVPGGSASVSAGFDLAESPEGTKVSWTGEAQVFGKLTSVAGGLLEPLAKKNIQKLIDGLLKSGWFRELPSASGALGGKPARRWAVNPKLFV